MDGPGTVGRQEQRSDHYSFFVIRTETTMEYIDTDIDKGGNTSKGALSQRVRARVSGRVRSLVWRRPRDEEGGFPNFTSDPVVQTEARDDDGAAVSNVSDDTDEKVTKITETGNGMFARGEYDRAMKMFLEAL
eukprot:4219779-Ditylum_brightwellii.AAC.1